MTAEELGEGGTLGSPDPETCEKTLVGGDVQPLKLEETSGSPIVGRRNQPVGIYKFFLVG